MNRGAKDVNYEDLPGGRTRETIVRDNGNQIVTIRNRNGDVMHRSRITPDGHEYVLSYVDERYYQDLHDWRDPGDDLPPIRLTIPRKQYCPLSGTTVPFLRNTQQGADDVGGTMEERQIRDRRRHHSLKLS